MRPVTERVHHNPRQVDDDMSLHALSACGSPDCKALSGNMQRRHRKHADRALTKGIVAHTQRCSQTALNKAAAEAMLISASILRLGASKAVAHGIDDDSRDRIVSSLKVSTLRHGGQLDGWPWLEGDR